MNYEKLNKQIVEQKSAILQTIKESVAIESVKSAPTPDAPYGTEIKRALDHLLSVGKSMGFKTGNCDNHVGWIEYGDGEEMVGILGHLDIVPLGDGWSYPPLDCEIHNGNIYGRGVLDDKGPIIGALYALKTIKDLELPIDRRIRILFGCDEENTSSCVAHYIKSGGELPTLGFTPDADFPAIFCEKGQANFFVRNKIIEPSQIKVLSLKGGIAKNSVAAECEMVIAGEIDIIGTDFVTVRKENGNTVLSSIGQSSHGSTPHMGKNAILRLLQVVKEIPFGGDFQHVIDFITTCIGTELDGKTLGISYHDEETGSTTVNLGMITCTDQETFFTLDIRYPNNIKQETIVTNVSTALANHELNAEVELHPLLYVSKESELMRKLMHVYTTQTGDTNAQPLADGGATYAKSFENMVAFGPVFPGEKKVIHQPDEYANIENLMKSIQLMGAAMYELAQK